MVTRKEIEFNNEWIQKFPELFSRHLAKWHNDCKMDGMVNFTMDLNRPGFITYIATKG